MDAAKGSRMPNLFLGGPTEEGDILDNKEFFDSTC
jgi:hypothetical protein